MTTSQWPFEFEAEIEREGYMNGAYVVFPESALAVFGAKGHIKVKVMFDGKISYRGSLASMGNGLHLLGVTKAVRKELGKSHGDIIHVTMEPDTEERTVEIPEDIVNLLKEFPEAEETFFRMSYSHKREIVHWVTDAKKNETRNRRLEKMVVMLLKKYEEKKGKLT